MSKQQYEGSREISFKEILWGFLFKWRVTIVCMICGAVMLTGFKYWRDTNVQQSVQEQPHYTVEEVRARLSEEELQALDKVTRLDAEVYALEEYIDNSIWMKIDPYNKVGMVIQYYVELVDEENLSTEEALKLEQNIVGAYYTYVGNKGIVAKEDNGKYLAELISAGMLEETGIFTVFINGDNEERVQDIANIVEKNVEEYATNLSDVMGKHELHLVGRNLVTGVDFGIETRQGDVRSKLADTKAALEEAINALSENQLYVYRADETSEIQTIETDMGNVKIRGSYIIYGAILGIIGSFGLVLLDFIFGSKVKYAQEIADMYGVPIVGRIVSKVSNNGKRKWNIIDNWLKAKKDKGIVKCDNTTEACVQTLVSLCKKNGLDSVNIISSMNLKEDVRTYINTQLENEKIQICLEEKVGSEAFSYDSVYKGNKVFILESERVTRYAELKKMMELCMMCDAEILGAIILDDESFK